MCPPDDPVQPPPTDLDAIRAEIARRHAIAAEMGQTWPTPAEVARRQAAIQAVIETARTLPVISDASEDEILGYGEDGLPT